MTDAPERIWIDIKSKKGNWTDIKALSFRGEAEYVRADLAVELMARINEGEKE